eukprot:TRINITY_DN5266_c0_g2_i1.p1 TRINITY_DN5266_c0_g2~~TRINITY_DN5266_c0_g2_i1.p1  ORF type:complete len:683 (-),score=153.58 TRINITY_DN5266_c0_g2_i1:563-2611(-)
MISEEPSPVIRPDASSPWCRNHLSRKERLPRACTSRSAASRLYPDLSPSADYKDSPQQCSKIVTPLLHDPLPSELPLRSLRSMSELASVLHFLHIFRRFLNIGIEFTAEELESALITPNDILDDVHIPLVRAIRPVARMALTRATWVSVLCRKLKHWWEWVADGEIPIVASHGTEVETYKMLDPGTRVRILKALCDIRVEQEDIRSYIDNSVKRRIPLSAFRKERIGGDSHGTSYWYEDDPIIGHRLYREIRKVEVKKVNAKAKGVSSLPTVSCQWETVATNLDEFQDVSEKLVSSKNRIEAALGKRLIIDILPEIEKIHKRKEKLLKKQHREAFLLDSYMISNGLASGRSLRDRKPVTYTFDDYDRSINEAIKITKKRQASPEPAVRRESTGKAEASRNGRWNGSSQASQWVFNDTPSPNSTDYDEDVGEHNNEPLDRTRRRQRPQRYSEKEFVEGISDNEEDFDSDDDIVGEAVYDDEYLRNRKQRKLSSSSEGDEEYSWEDENVEDEDEEEDNSLSISEDIEEPRRSKNLPRRRRRGMKLRSVDEIESGLRRSKRATRIRIDYKQYELSDSGGDSSKVAKSNASDGDSDASNNVEDLAESQESQDDDDQEMKDHQLVDTYDTYMEAMDREQGQVIEKANNPSQEVEVVRKRRFLDLNELAPGGSFDDGPSTTIEGEDTD